MSVGTTGTCDTRLQGQETLSPVRVSGRKSTHPQTALATARATSARPAPAANAAAHRLPRNADSTRWGNGPVRKADAPTPWPRPMRAQAPPWHHRPKNHVLAPQPQPDHAPHQRSFGSTARPAPKKRAGARGPRARPARLPGCGPPPPAPADRTALAPGTHALRRPQTARTPPVGKGNLAVAWPPMSEATFAPHGDGRRRTAVPSARPHPWRHGPIRGRVYRAPPGAGPHVPASRSHCNAIAPRDRSADNGAVQDVGARRAPPPATPPGHLMNHVKRAQRRRPPRSPRPRPGRTAHSHAPRHAPPCCR